MERLIGFGFKFEFKTLILLAVAVLLAAGVYIPYFRSRLAPDLRVGLTPSGVRLGAIAFSLCLFGLVMSLAGGIGFGLLLILFVVALGLAIAGRNRILLYVVLCATVVLAIGLRLLFGR